jgi:hypothetical protein
VKQKSRVVLLHVKTEDHAPMLKITQTSSVLVDPILLELFVKQLFHALLILVKIVEFAQI